MLVKPIFKYHFHVEVAEDEDVVYLLSEKTNHCLRGYLYRLLAPLLDGKHTVADIVASLQLFYPETRIKEVLSHLEKQGYIVDADEAMPNSEAAFWNLQGIDTKNVVSRTKSATVSVITFGQISEESFIELLCSLGIRIGKNGDLTLVLTDDYLRPELDFFDLDQLTLKKPWMLIKPVGGILWIGPLFVPGETGCWQCLAHRLRENREVETALLRQSAKSSPFRVSRAMLPTTLHTGFSLAATQAALCLVHKNNFALKGIISTIDMGTLSAERHILTKRPQCRSCGTQTEIPFQPVVLQSRKKTFTGE